MSKLIRWGAVLVACSLPAGAFAQGFISINNFGTGANGWAAPWYNNRGVVWMDVLYPSHNPLDPTYSYTAYGVGGVPLAGTGYTAELWGGPEGATADQLQPLGRGTFRTGSLAGLVQSPPTGSSLPVPFASVGQRVTVQMRVWDNQDGRETNWSSAASSAVAYLANASELFLTPPLQNGVAVSLQGMNSYGMLWDVTIPARLPVISVNTGGSRNYGVWLDLAGGSPITLVEGETVTLAGESPPPGATWQWGFAGANINGATNRQLVLTNIQLSQAGVYTLVAVTNLTTTIVARMTNWISLSVTNRPRLLDPTRTLTGGSSNRFTAVVSPAGNRFFQVLRSSDLSTWTTQQTIWMGRYAAGTNNSFTSTVAATNQQYYRVRVVP